MVKKDISIFQKKIWNFYALNKRDFPWRETSDTYKIFISEVMLQQTQTSRVLPKYLLFLENFPSFEALASSRNEDVLRLWSGLGYNRRALYLKRAAEIIVKENKKDNLAPGFLETLPGIGPNTAGSIYVFSNNLPHVFIETNIRRVFIHEFFKNQEKISDKEILQLIALTLPREVRDWYYALMDYGAFLGKQTINPNLKSKHYTKQSKFEGSIRQARGKILKILLTEKNIPEGKLEKMINSVHYAEAIKQLEKENFILLSQHDVSLK